MNPRPYAEEWAEVAGEDPGDLCIFIRDGLVGPSELWVLGVLLVLGFASGFRSFCAVCVCGSKGLLSY